jgi:hypothetical protein
MLGMLAAGTGVGLVMANNRFKQLFSLPIVPPSLNLDMPLVISRSEWGARLPDHQAPNEFGFATSPLNPEWYRRDSSLRQFVSLQRNDDRCSRLAYGCERLG